MRFALDMDSLDSFCMCVYSARIARCGGPLSLAHLSRHLRTSAFVFMVYQCQALANHKFRSHYSTCVVVHLKNQARTTSALNPPPIIYLCTTVMADLVPAQDERVILFPFSTRKVVPSPAWFLPTISLLPHTRTLKCTHTHKKFRSLECFKITILECVKRSIYHQRW